MNGPKLESLLAVASEVEAARSKHPGSRHMLAALAEEVGELAQELNEHGNTPNSKVEAKQVACVAIRIMEEGDSDFVAAPNAAPADAGKTRAWKPRRAARKARSAQSATPTPKGKKAGSARPAGGARRKKTTRPEADAPCLECGGTVDRSGRGGWRKTLCASCASERSAVRHAVHTDTCVDCRQVPAVPGKRLCEACEKKAQRLRRTIGHTTPAPEEGAA